jgi:acyl-CoA synthetase (AMP-forming)/AMP-acid ligase II
MPAARRKAGEVTPGDEAQAHPDKPAVTMAEGGQVVTFAELEARSNQLAHLLRSRGLGPGSHLAVLLPNHHRYHEVCWAGQRSGLYFTPINWHLGPAEAGYIISDCGAQALVTSSALSDLVGQLDEYLTAVTTRLVVDGALPGFEDYEQALAGQPTVPIADESEGSYMFYSSGTTGRPKGIKPPLTGAPYGTGTTLDPLLSGVYGFSSDTRYLCPAPLYHAAPLGWSLGTQRLGGRVVVMERFDALEALRLIEAHRITHVQFVPTHFIRMLKLTDEERQRYDLSSLQTVVHAAAPCPVEVKRQMLEWWGPIIYEYYAGSEGNGFCAIGPEEWLAHPGSVGRNLRGTVHILGEDGDELGRGEIGQIWFEGPTRFEYHNDPVKTASAWNDRGWSTLGDVGYLAEDDYLFLTDRVSHMIISGGVNIYPQEVEDVLVLHPAVTDVAVIGVPDPEMGEAVKAVVQLAHPDDASDALAAELIAFCRDRLAHFKCPRTVDFVDELPRLPTGKLLKRVLRDRYEQTGHA